MRVASLAVSLLGMACIRAGHAQIVSTAEGAMFNRTAPTAINNSSFIVPELAMPVRQAALTTGVSARGTAHVMRLPTVARTPARVAASHSVVSVPIAHASTGFTLPARALQSRQPPLRSVTDHLLAGVVALMLIAYQLRRKHRVLRPHPFTT